MTQNDPNRKTRFYLTGMIAGATFGLLSAYLYTRAAEEDGEDGQPNPIGTMQLIGLILSALSLIRQIAESGKRPKRK